MYGGCLLCPLYPLLNCSDLTGNKRFCVWPGGRLPEVVLNGGLTVFLTYKISCIFPSTFRRNQNIVASPVHIHVAKYIYDTLIPSLLTRRHKKIKEQITCDSLLNSLSRITTEWDPLTQLRNKNKSLKEEVLLPFSCKTCNVHELK